MGGFRTAEEVEQRHIRALGPELGALYSALENEVVGLHAKWLQYRKLYGTSKERV